MKNFFKNIILFLALAIPAYIILVILWGNLNISVLSISNMGYHMRYSGHMHTRLLEVDTLRKTDLLFMGSSHCYRGFDTRVYENAGIKTFNLGSSGQSPVQTRALYDKYINHLNPELVILEVFPETFASDGVESSFDLIANGPIHTGIIKMSLRINNIKLYNSLIYAIYYHQSKTYKNFFEESVIGNDRYHSGGYVEKMSTDFKPNRSNFSKVNLLFKRHQINSFEYIINDLKKREIDYILVQTPVMRELYQSFSNSSAIDSTFSSWGKYINMNMLNIVNEPEDYFDYDHLNASGVEKINKALLDQIKNSLR